jgi:hypothetical protein
MIHPVKIDDMTGVGNRFLKEYPQHRKGAENDPGAVTSIMPDGYVTGEKFWADEKNHTKQFCLENGIL